MADVKLFELNGVVVSDTTDSEVTNVIGSAHFILRNRGINVFFNIALSGGSAIAFDVFEMQAQFVKNGTWITITSVWTTADGVLTFVPGNVLNTLAHGSDENAKVNVRGIWAIRFRSAQAAVTASPVTRTLEIGLSSQE